MYFLRGDVKKRINEVVVESENDKSRRIGKFWKE